MSKFKDVNDIGQHNIISSIEDNLKSFLDWGFLNIGGFIDINIPENGSTGPAFAKVMNDPSNNTNTVWETERKDWVYESGVVHKDRSPINISGIYLNNTFLQGPSGSGAYTYSLNYPLGRITFNNPVSPSSKVCLNYSYKYVQVYKANESIWWKELQNNTYYKNNPDYNISSNHRIQLPAIIVETIARTVLTPYELGTAENVVKQDVLLHVFTENPVQRNSIMDILLLQKDKTLYLNNITKMIKNNVNNLDYKGQPNNNRLNYDQLQNNSAYFLKKCYINNCYTSEMNAFSSSLYNAIIRWTLEIFP